MDRKKVMNMEHEVFRILSQISGLPQQSISKTDHLFKDLSLNSFQTLELRELLEEHFQKNISDHDLFQFTTVNSVCQLLLNANSKKRSAVDILKHSTDVTPTSTSFTINSFFIDRFEVGMPHMAENQLAENPILKHLGHLQWQHVSKMTGVSSKDIVDEDGSRLYMTFFYIEECFPINKPMSFFGENDSFWIVSQIVQYTSGIIYGVYFLLSLETVTEHELHDLNEQTAKKRGIPYFILANSFVKQWQGAGWLKKSRPAHTNFNLIPKLTSTPPLLENVKRAKDDRVITPPPESFTLWSHKSIQYTYKITPERDLNGAGLLYFANYTLILDIAERELLSQHIPSLVPSDFFSKRTLIKRWNAYFSNATKDELLTITMNLWFDPTMRGADFIYFTQYEMHRHSDNRLMMVSSAHKKTELDPSLIKLFHV